MNVSIMEEILYFFGFTFERHLMNKDTGGFFLFPHSLENIELNLGRFLSKKYVLTEELVKNIFEDEKESINIIDNSPRTYTPTIKPYYHKGCSSNENLSRILEIHGVLEEKAEDIFDNFDPEPDCKKIYEKIIKQTKTVKDLLLLKIMSFIISDNILNIPTSITKDISDIFNEIEIPKTLHSKIEYHDSLTHEYQRIWLNSLFSEIPRSFINFYAHGFNSTGCRKEIFILFHQKMVDYLDNLFDLLSLDKIILKSFNDLLINFQSKYLTPLLDFRDTTLFLCDKIFDSWVINKHIFSDELADYEKELHDLIKQNLLILDDDQVLLKDGYEGSEMGLQYFENSKLYRYRDSLREKENNRIEYNRNKIIAKWLFTKVKIKNDKIMILNDFTPKSDENKEKFPETRASDDLMDETFNKFQKMLNITEKIEISVVAKMMAISDSELLIKLIDWGEKLSFRIDNNFIVRKDGDIIIQESNFNDKIQPPFKACNKKEPYIFVSYAHRDKKIVFPIIDTLNKEGFKIWYDEGIPISSNWEQVIIDSLGPAKIILAFISTCAMESKNIENELLYALDHNKKILPIYIEDSELSSRLDFRRLQDFQGILRYKLTNSRFIMKLLSVLDKYF